MTATTTAEVDYGKYARNTDVWNYVHARLRYIFKEEPLETRGHPDASLFALRQGRQCCKVCGFQAHRIESLSPTVEAHVREHIVQYLRSFDDLDESIQNELIALFTAVEFA